MSCNLKTTKLLDCTIIGVCAEIGSSLYVFWVFFFFFVVVFCFFRNKVYQVNPLNLSYEGRGWCRLVRISAKILNRSGDV